MKDKLLPADTYTVFNQTVLTELDKKILTSLYQPIIGGEAISLYLTFWSDLDKLEIQSDIYTHHHLMVMLKSKLETIENARKALEAVGLLKSFLKRNDNINDYIYELYSPLSGYEFFNHPVLNVLLKNNIGEDEYNVLFDMYKKTKFKHDGYEEITSSMNETFKSVPSSSMLEIREQEKLGLNIEETIDFDLVEKTIPSGLITSKTFNKKIKKLINQLAFIYGIDTIKMIEIIRLSIEDFGLIDKDKLISNARNNYEYNNNGRLPTIIYRSQPEYLKTPEGDTSTKGKIIKVYENTTPNDFLRARNKGAAPTKYDLGTLEQLAINNELPPGVINVLIDYSLKVNDGKFTRNYVLQVASSLQRQGIKTVSDAMEYLTKNHKKVNKKISSTSTSTVKKQIASVPTWINTDVSESEMTEEELKEIQEDFKEFRR